MSVSYKIHLGALNRWRLSNTTFNVGSFSRRLEWYIDLLNVVKSRSGCHKQVGSILINSQNHIVSMGFNGTPSKMPHCEDKGCFKVKRWEGNPPQLMEHCIATIHAEINTLANFEGSFNQELIMISTHEPCLSCVKVLMSFRIKRVFYLVDYPDFERDDLLRWFEEHSYSPKDVIQTIPIVKTVLPDKSLPGYLEEDALEKRILNKDERILDY